MGESQCAEECFKWEAFEEADEDEEGQGGGEHCCFQLAMGGTPFLVLNEYFFELNPRKNPVLNNFFELNSRKNPVLNNFFELNPRKNPVLNNIFELNFFINPKMNNFLN